MIQLEYGYEIYSETIGYKLVYNTGKLRPGRNGELFPKFKEITYHTTLTDAFNQYYKNLIHKNLTTNDKQTIDDVIQLISKIEEEVHSTLKQTINK